MSEPNIPTLLKFENKQICVLDVKRSSEPIYLNGPKGKEFYVRVGNTTRPLDPQQTVNFINMNWN